MVGVAKYPKGSLKFWVKWAGWNRVSDMTWEPEDHLR